MSTCQASVYQPSHITLGELGNHSVLPLTITLNVSLLNPFLSLLVMVCFSFLLAWPTSATSPLWHLDTSIYLIFGRRSALYNFLWSLIPSLTSPVDVLFTVPSPPRPAKEKSCTIPHLFKTIHVWNYGRKKILLFFNASITSDTFVYIAWSDSVWFWDKFVESTPWRNPCFLFLIWACALTIEYKDDLEQSSLFFTVVYFNVFQIPVSNRNFARQELTGDFSAWSCSQHQVFHLVFTNMVIGNSNQPKHGCTLGINNWIFWKISLIFVALC